MFVTGAIDPPIKVEELQISFQPKDEFLPGAHTCTKQLHLPLGNKTYDEFKENCLKAVKDDKVGFYLERF